MRHKARLDKFLVDRIHRDWIDRLYPQGWEEDDLPPSETCIDTINLTSSTGAK